MSLAITPGEPQAQLRLLADMNQDVFKYGLFKGDDSLYEDPTYLGFTLEMDSNSAILNQPNAFLQRRGIQEGNIELSSRLPIYSEFINKARMLFNSQESIVEEGDKSTFVKSHYINSVSGLNTLSKKFIEWKKDFIELELYEDISMFSTYLSTLYNNLVYSYQNGRVLIPENMLHFDLHIKISEIRSFTSIGKLASQDLNDQAIANALKNNVTCHIYTLHDCLFNFFDSHSFGDEIVQAGIGTNLPAPSVLPMKIWFKSVSRQLYTPLIKRAYSVQDARIDLGTVIVGYTGDLKPNSKPDGSGSKGDIQNSDISTPYQQGQISNATSISDRAIFGSAKTKRPSSERSYNREIKQNPAIDTSNDISTRFDQLGDIDQYNQPLEPSTNTLQPAGPGELLTSPNITLRDILDDPNAALQKYANNKAAAFGNATNNLANRAESIIKQRLKQVENEIIRKRNELIRSFVYDVVQRTGTKKIVPDNVYYDTDFRQRLLDQLRSDIGINLASETLNFLTGAR